jgi:hypothetical protein
MRMGWGHTSISTTPTSLNTLDIYLFFFQSFCLNFFENFQNHHFTTISFIKKNIFSRDPPPLFDKLNFLMTLIIC